MSRYPIERKVLLTREMNEELRRRKGNLTYNAAIRLALEEWLGCRLKMGAPPLLRAKHYLPRPGRHE